MITNIFGPPASGKTRNKAAFQTHFSAKRVIEFDDIAGPSSFADGDLILSQLALERPPGFRIQHVSIEDALALIGNKIKN